MRVYAYPEPVDLRKGYDGLFGRVKTGLERDPLRGDLFLFVNRPRKGCKVLLWDGTGLCIFQKRLERGAFESLWRKDGDVVRMTASELAKEASWSYVGGFRPSRSFPRRSISKKKRTKSAPATRAFGTALHVALRLALATRSAPR
ncbi:hypothetical protein BH09MYX1_BH09MYX1_48400 [soil metagenome]